MRQFSFVKGRHLGESYDSISETETRPGGTYRRQVAGAGASTRCGRRCADPRNRQRLSPNTDAHDYRFDPPQARSLHHPHDGDTRRGVSRRESPILPRTDPFAIPSPGVMETFGPIVRLVLLIALFTAAGVILLAGGNDQQPSVREKTSAETTVTKQSLEPAAVVAEASASASTAAGPASVPDSSKLKPLKLRVDLGDPVDEPAPDAVQASGGADRSRRPPVSADRLAVGSVAGGRPRCPAPSTNDRPTSGRRASSRSHH